MLDGFLNHDHTEVIKKYSCPDLLADAVTVSGMNSGKISRILKMPERDLYAPAKVVKLSDLFGREHVSVKISNDRFIFFSAINPETDNSVSDRIVRVILEYEIKGTHFG